MEAFKKTSHDFREVVYQLTGFRIDVLADQKYRLLPLYAETCWSRSSTCSSAS